MLLNWDPVKYTAISYQQLVKYYVEQFVKKPEPFASEIGCVEQLCKNQRTNHKIRVERKVVVTDMK